MSSVPFAVQPAASRAVRALVSAVVLAALPAAVAAEDHETESHRFREVAPGVFFVSEAGSLMLMSNAMVVVNDEDVVVVDSHVTPMAARALLEGIASFTDKPVTTLINTHYHFDHAHGNQAFGPDVEIIGSEFTRRKLAGSPLEERTFTSFTEMFEQRLEGMLDEKEAGTGDVAGQDAAIERIESFLEAQKEIVPTPPTIAVTEKMTLFRGSREIQVHFLGRGHTGGDVVVLLPEERVIFTGDLLLPRLSYMGDGHVDEWGATLERVAALDFDLVLPGHGEPFTERSKIGQLQEYYGDLWAAVAEQRESGASAAEAAMRIDLTRHQELGVDERGAEARAVLRIYELLDERGL